MEPKKTFYHDVDKRSKKEMVDFLSSHFRYNTMNSWNRSGSYANKVKIWDVIPSSLQGKVFEMMDVEGFYDDINFILEDYGLGNDYHYQAGFNGRSGGYIVMYEGYRKLSDHKSYCTSCYQRNFKTIEETGNNKCGKCGENKRVNKTFYEVGSWPGRSIDQGEDFEDWDIGSLRSRVELVRSFDKMCDAVVFATIRMAEEKEIVEEVIMIPKTIKSIQ